MKTTIKTNNLTKVIEGEYDASRFPIGFSALTLAYESTTEMEPKVKTHFEIDVWVYNDEEDKENTPNKNYWNFQHAQVEHDDDMTYVVNTEEEYALSPDELIGLTEEQIIDHIRSLI